MLLVMPKLRALQLFSKLKTVHFGLMAMSVVPVIDAYIKDSSSTQWMEILNFKYVVGSVMTLFTLCIASVFISRVIGQILYYPKDKEILITTVNFWGNQLDRRYPVNQIVPWSETRGGPAPDRFHDFHHLRIGGHNRPFYYSLKWSVVKDVRTLSELLYLPSELGGRKDKVWEDAFERASRSQRRR